MKLSDAIMLNGMTKPQGHGCYSIMSVDAPCAIGGALQTIGKQDTQSMIGNYRAMKDSWLWTCLDIYPCPACTDRASVINLIWQLNDVHHWTRQQIAEWVATVEPEEPVDPPYDPEGINADIREQLQEALCTTQK